MLGIQVLYSLDFDIYLQQFNAIRIENQLRLQFLLHL